MHPRPSAPPIAQPLNAHQVGQFHFEESRQVDPPFVGGLGYLPRISRMPVSWRIRGNLGTCYVPQRRRIANQDLFPGKPRSAYSKCPYAQNARTYGDSVHTLALTYDLYEYRSFETTAWLVPGECQAPKC